MSLFLSPPFLLSSLLLVSERTITHGVIRNSRANPFQRTRAVSSRSLRVYLVRVFVRLEVRVANMKLSIKGN